MEGSATTIKRVKVNVPLFHVTNSVQNTHKNVKFAYKKKKQIATDEVKKE